MTLLLPVLRNNASTVVSMHRIKERVLSTSGRERERERGEREREGGERERNLNKAMWAFNAGMGGGCRTAFASSDEPEGSSQVPSGTVTSGADQSLFCCHWPFSSCVIIARLNMAACGLSSELSMLESDASSGTPNSLSTVLRQALLEFVQVHRGSPSAFLFEQIVHAADVQLQGS